MLTFNQQNGKVVIDAYTRMISEIEEVVEKFKEDPDEGIRVLTYIHLCARIDPKAPFFEASETDIWELAERNVWRGEPQEKEAIESYKKVVSPYRAAFSGPESNAITIFNDKIYQIQRLIKDTKPEIVKYETAAGSKGFASNVATISKAMKDLDDLLDAKEKLQARLQKHVQKEGKIQGKKQPSRLERQSMNGNI